MTTDKAYQALRNHPDLPSPKGVALEIMRLARSPACSLSELARVVEADPAIASRILKLVNSSACPHGRPIVSLTEAIAYLGTRMVQCIALGFSLVTAGRRCRSFDYVGFWSESLARAVAASRLAQSVAAYVPDELFTLGLLSQLGRLVFASTCPDRYQTLLDTVRCDKQELRELERELFDIDHVELTARLMRDWGLPPIVVDAVRLQYETEQGDLDLTGEPGRLAGVLSLASRASEQIVAARKSHQAQAAAMMEQASRLGLEPSEVVALIEYVLPQWRDMVEIFGLDELSEAEIKGLYAEAAALRQLVEPRPA